MCIRDRHDTIRQKQQEQGETNNNMLQKLEEVDGRQRSMEQKLDETTEEKTTRIEELKCHLTKVRENQERLQRQLMEGECCLLYTSRPVLFQIFTSLL